MLSNGRNPIRFHCSPFTPLGLQCSENLAYGVYIGMLLATLLGLGRMTSHSETIAMQAGGVSFMQIATRF